MTGEQTDLWNRIQNFELDDIDSAYTFSDRLALENGWTLEYALRVIDEYKKYIFLHFLVSLYFLLLGHVFQLIFFLLKF